MGMAEESRFHVLAVDDCLLYRKVIERLLKKSSFHVTTVDSGAKALEFLGLRQDVHNKDPLSSSKNHQESEVNLILTDYCMPGMTGYDLLKKIKETSSLRHIPVVIMSSENVPSRITECLEEGAEEFLLKPVRESDLIKLKPLMMRTKPKNQTGKPEIKEGISAKPEILSRQEQEQQHKEVKQQEMQEQEEQPIKNKRKALEEGLTQDRTRPRFDEITTVV